MVLSWTVLMYSSHWVDDGVQGPVEEEEQGLKDPFKTNKPVFPGSRYVFNLSLFGVPLLVQ